MGIDPPSVDFTPTLLGGGTTVTVNEQLDLLPLGKVPGRLVQTGGKPQLPQACRVT
jgi:hypothetical protein